MNKNIAVIGSGFSGAIIAHILAEAGYPVTVFEKSSHVGGNCYTERDKQTNILVHKYGPHIFHTDNAAVWNFVNNLTQFKPFINRVKATSGGKVYSLPVNLHTINQFYGTTFRPAEARDFIQSQADTTIVEPTNFEEQALRFIGRGLYEAFFKGYTTKQWGCDPRELPASILKRLPVRFNYDDNYFSHRYQGIPENGYTPIFEKLLDHPGITVKLNQHFKRPQKQDFYYCFYSGPLDLFFDYQHGPLGYRSLRFEPFYAEGDYQGCAVMNYCDPEVPYTRITEHKHFSPWESHDGSVLFKEYSFAAGKTDTPYYPTRLAKDKDTLQRYIDTAENTPGISFVGRLGTYRYLDMDKVVEESIDTAKHFIECEKGQRTMPTFYVSPLS